jgi:hypothetical protein
LTPPSAFFRKMLNKIPLPGARSNWHKWGKTFPVTIIKGRRGDRFAAVTFDLPVTKILQQGIENDHS